MLEKTMHLTLVILVSLGAVVLQQEDISELCEYYMSNHTTEPMPPWMVC